MSNDRIVEKQQIKLSDVIVDILRSTTDVVNDDSIWQLFGYKGCPSYNSKISILFDAFNLKKKLFLVREMNCISIGIRLNSLFANNVVSFKEKEKVTNYALLVVLNNYSVVRSLSLDKPEIRNRFCQFVREYINVVYDDLDHGCSKPMAPSRAFLEHVGVCKPTHMDSFRYVFYNHLKKEDIDGKNIEIGLRNLIDLNFNAGNNISNKILKNYNIVDNISLQ